jgi:hypothetical protein
MEWFGKRGNEIRQAAYQARRATALNTGYMGWTLSVSLG